MTLADRVWFVSFILLSFLTEIVNGNLQGLQIHKRHTVNIQKPCQVEQYSYFKGNLHETCLLLEEEGDTKKYNILVRKSEDLGKSWNEEKRLIEGGTPNEIKNFFTFTGNSLMTILYFDISESGEQVLYHLRSKDGYNFSRSKTISPTHFVKYWSFTQYSANTFKIFGIKVMLLCGIYNKNSVDDWTVYRQMKTETPFIFCVGSEDNAIHWQTKLYFNYKFDSTLGEVYSVSPKIFESELGFKIEYSTQTSQHNAQYIKCVPIESNYFDCYHMDIGYQRVLKDFTKVNGFYLAIESPEDTDNKNECYLHFVYHRLFVFPDNDNLSIIPKKNNQCRLPQIISMEGMAFLSYHTESPESRVLTLFSLDGIVTHCTILTEPLIPTSDITKQEISEFFDENEVAIASNISLFKDRLLHAERFELISNRKINKSDEIENYLNPGFEKKNGKYMCEVQWSDLVHSGENKILTIIVLNHKEKNVEVVPGSTSMLYISAFTEPVEEKNEQEDEKENNKTSEDNGPYTLLRNIQKIVHDSFNKATGNKDNTNENTESAKEEEKDTNEKKDINEIQHNTNFIKLNEVDIESADDKMKCSLPLSFSDQFPSLNLVHSIEKTVMDEFFTEYKLRIHKNVEQILFYPISVHCALGKNFFLKLNFDITSHVTLFNTSFPFLQVQQNEVLNLKFPSPSDVNYKYFSPFALNIPEETTFIKLDSDRYIYRMPAHFNEDKTTMIAFPYEQFWNLKKISFFKGINFENTISVDIRVEEQNLLNKESGENQEKIIKVGIPLKMRLHKPVKVELICAIIKENKNTCFHKVNVLQEGVSKEMVFTELFDTSQSDVLIYPKYFVHSKSPTEIYEQSSVSFGESFILNYSNFKKKVNTFSCKCPSSKGNIYEIYFTFKI